MTSLQSLLPEEGQGEIPSAASIGTFDGVHRGHRLVVEMLLKEADERGLRPLIFTFDRHPLRVIAPDRAPAMLSDNETRHRLLTATGAREIVVPFTPELRHLTAREWMMILRDRYGVRLLVTGYDNTFGSDGRQLSHDDIAAIGRELGIEVTVAPCLPGCSSTAVRKALKEGDVVKAAEILGRPYTLGGKVVRGQQIGRTLGFPTANVEPPSWRAVPADGVYAADAVTADGSRYRAIVNIGRRPTVGDHLPPTIEANLLGFDGDLYGQTLELAFLRRLRDERKFPSLEELRRQLDRDREEAMRI